MGFGLSKRSLNITNMILAACGDLNSQLRGQRSTRDLALDQTALHTGLGEEEKRCRVEEDDDEGVDSPMHSGKGLSQ